jgi:hypothetical protein
MFVLKKRMSAVRDNLQIKRSRMLVEMETMYKKTYFNFRKVVA